MNQTSFLSDIFLNSSCDFPQLEKFLWGAPFERRKLEKRRLREYLQNSEKEKLIIGKNIKLYLLFERNPFQKKNSAQSSKFF